jgi:hypothetical protein
MSCRAWSNKACAAALSEGVAARECPEDAMHAKATASARIEWQASRIDGYVKES